VTHLFKKLTDGNFDVEGPALVVKNVTQGPFEVDEDGRTLHSMGIAAIDDQCPICKSGIETGKLVVLKTIKVSKNKNKSVLESSEETASTVAPAEDNDSVQLGIKLTREVLK